MIIMLSRRSIVALFCLIPLLSVTHAQDIPSFQDSTQFFAAPNGLPDPTGGNVGSDDPTLVEFSQKAYMAAMSAKLEHYRALGYKYSKESNHVNAAAQQGIAKQSNSTIQVIGGTSDEPSGTVDLPVNTALSCPGYYIVRSHGASVSEKGRFGLELLLHGGGRRTLQGGLNFGGRATSSVSGFSAFNIANSNNENQLVNIGISVGAPGQLTLKRRSGGQVVATPLDTNIPSGESDFTVTVPVGFYVVGYTPSTSASTRYAISALSSYVNRPGGGFQGGAVVGGYHDPSMATASRSTGFATFCIAEAREVSVSIQSRPTYGSSGSTGMEFSLSAGDGTAFLDSRTPESNPEISLTNSVTRMGDYPGIFTQTGLYIPEAAHTRVGEVFGTTSELLDFLLDFFVIGVVSDLADEDKRALGAQLNHDEAFLAQLRVFTDDGLFVWPDLGNIAGLPVPALFPGEPATDLSALTDAVLLELDELGLSDISLALADGQPLKITGFEGVLDPGTLVPGADTARQLADSLRAFLLGSSNVTYLETTEDGYWIRTEADTAKLIRFLLQLASDLGLDEAGEGDLFTLAEIEAMIAELELAPTAISDFFISEGEMQFMAIEIASLDPTLGLNPGDVWLTMHLDEYIDALLPFEDAVLFDLCRLPEDLFVCMP